MLYKIYIHNDDFIRNERVSLYDFPNNRTIKWYNNIKEASSTCTYDKFIIGIHCSNSDYDNDLFLVPIGFGFHPEVYQGAFDMGKLKSASCKLQYDYVWLSNGTLEKLKRLNYIVPC